MQIYNLLKNNLRYDNDITYTQQNEDENEDDNEDHETVETI